MTEANDTDDMKRKFREALERKNSQKRSGEAHLDGESSVHDVHTFTQGKRQFRRKAGG